MSRVIALTQALLLLASPALAQSEGPDDEGAATTAAPADEGAATTAAPGDGRPAPAPADGGEAPGSAPVDPYEQSPSNPAFDRPSGDEPGAREAANRAPADSESPPIPAADDEPAPQASAGSQRPAKPLGPILPAGHPRLFLAHTGRMVPAAVVYWTTSLDTSGGLSSDARIGLGDIAEFGIEALDQVRYTTSGTDESDERVAPLFLATFKLGLPEDRFFRHQPALALVYRKSFQAEEENHKLRTAELALIASKAFGPRFSAHLGGVIGDAEIEYQGDGSKAELNERDFVDKTKLFGGIEARVKPRADIILEWSYVPRFILRDSSPRPEDMRMQAQFLWGVRYKLTRAVDIESGVRIADIVDTNLIDAHIFGRLTIAFDRIQRAIRSR